MLDEAEEWGYTEGMARTLNQHTQTRDADKKNTDKKTGRAKRRERPFGAAVGWAVAATLAMGLIILGVQLLMPSSAVHNMYLLAHYNSSPTLREDPLFQQWMADINREEAFATALSLLCGGLTLGGLAPAYAGRRRVLRAAAVFAFAVVAVSLAFVWPTAIVQQNRLNEAGGRVVQVGIPPELMVRQAILTVLWIGVCVVGAWAGLWARRRGRAEVAP